LIKADTSWASLGKDELFAQVASKIKEELKKEIEKTVAAEQIEKSAALRRNTILGRYKLAVERLAGEIEEVRKAGTTNLLFGSLIAVGGMTTLAIAVINFSSIKLTTLEYVIYFVPRVALTFVMQLFAYFFLSLYRKAHAEIKFLQNEITNLDMKYIALRSVIDSPDSAAYNAVINNIVSIERNSILRKGETTAELEVAKIEKDQASGLVKELIALVKASKGNG
jgi:hypothetical protein